MIYESHDGVHRCFSHGRGESVLLRRLIDILLVAVIHARNRIDERSEL